jgi:endo-1,3(4)-beta-glucanase
MGVGAWGGVVSSGSYVTVNDGVDFGNTYYNDHHFHWGYFILAASLIGHIDSNWIKDNREYVDMLCRDISNPSSKDKYFPEWRSYDWYHGHSWAKGLFASIDGKVCAQERKRPLTGNATNDATQKYRTKNRAQRMSCTPMH